jgi:hypothetical protein
MFSQAQLDKLQRPALTVGLVASGLCLVGGMLGLEQALRSLLVSGLFWWGMAIGCLALTVLNHLVGGRWGYRTRPILTAGITTLPLVAVLFVPVVVGLKHLYVWADAEVVAADALLQQKAAYLDPWFFRARSVGYFLIWFVLGWLFSQRRVSQAANRGPSHPSGLSGMTLVVLALSVSFAAIDWAMSLEPRWYSTIYGALMAAGGLLAAMALVVGAVALGGAGPIDREQNIQVLHDLGSLLLAFVMLWSYFAFSQFLIIWSGNLPDEIRWYLHRLSGGWQWVALVIVLFQFVAPLLMLLSRQTKCNPRAMLGIAAMILTVHYVDVFWNVAPAFHKSRLTIHWLDLVTPVATGGLWLFVFVWQLRRRMYGESRIGPLSVSS